MPVKHRTQRPSKRPATLAPILGALGHRIDALDPNTAAATLRSQQERRTRGAAAEQRFRDWLDRCHLPHLYVEQSPLTFPRGLPKILKRPDFLIGIPSIGTIAVDVKSKRIYADTLIIDLEEHTNLMTFESAFNIPVWFAAFPPNETNTCHLFRNRLLASLPVSTRKKISAVKVLPLKRTHLADDRRDFLAALMGAI